MSGIDETLTGMLNACLAPVHEGMRRISSELEALRRALPPSLLPLREAAKRMGVSYATARRRAKNGEWPTRRDGGRLLVDVGALHPTSEDDLAQAAREARGLSLMRRGNDGNS